MARGAFDGAEVIDGKIYFTGVQLGFEYPGSTILERYDPSTDSWEILPSRPKVRYASCTTVLNGKYYVMGGITGDTSVEIYDPTSNSWSEGVSMPVEVNHCGAVTYEGKLYVVGDDRVIVFDPVSNEWALKAECDLTTYGTALAIYENRIWSFTQQGVESYDPLTDTWRSEESPSVNREFGTAWTHQDKLYFACGRVFGNARYNTIEIYDANNLEWLKIGEFPDECELLDSVVLDDKVFIIEGFDEGGFSDNFSQ